MPTVIAFLRVFALTCSKLFSEKFRRGRRGNLFKGSPFGIKLYFPSRAFALFGDDVARFGKGDLG